MNAEERALKAIQLTRIRLEEVLRAPEALVAITAWDVEPDAVEDAVTRILEYLDKTKDEEK